MAKIDALFKVMLDEGASDLHMASGQKPALRIHGEIKPFDSHNVLDHYQLRTMLFEITPDNKKADFEKTGDVDFGYELPGVARFRGNMFQQKFGCAAVFRQIPSKILSTQDLGLPSILTRAAMLRKGLVLVTGPTGSGRSTTLAAMLDHANRNRKDHIMTIEDPIEFVHQGQGCVVNHREVGVHTESFTTALRAALREDPDIILIGEMRDPDTIRLAVEAAATGQLVFGTLRTTSAVKAVDAVIESFPYEEQGKIRTSLSTSLKLVVAQNLFRRIDTKGRCAALEILVCTNAIATLIREEKTFQIASAMQAGKTAGMQSLDDAILDLLNKKWISPEEAYEKCNEKAKFASFLNTPPDELT